MISDFFQVEILFEMLFQIYLVDQIKLAPDLLISLLDYDKDHPKTKLFLQCLSESISLTSEQIFSMISSKSTREMLSTNKLKNKIRDILRHSKYVNKCLRTLCSFCNKMGLYMKVDTMTFRFMSLTPCCGSLIHNTCIADFNSSYRCEECTTFLYKGRVDFEMDTLEQSFKRYAKRRDNNIPHNHDLPLLSYYQ